MKRAFDRGIEMWHFCNDQRLLEDDGDSDLQEMIFEFQTTGAKLAGALDGLAYDDGLHDGGFVVAALKRALDYLHKSIAAAGRVSEKNLLSAERLGPFRSELFEIREEILALMERYRNSGN